MNNGKNLFHSNSEDSALTLDPSVLKEKRQGSESVTDEYGISVFSHEFRKHMSDYQQWLKQNGIDEKIFVENMNDDEVIHIEEAMFREPMAVTKANNNAAFGDLTPSSYGWVFGVMLICFAVFSYKYHRKGKKYDHYTESQTERIS